MKKALIFSALVFLLLAAACGGLPTPQTTSAEATALAAGLTMLPQGTGVVITTIPMTVGPGTPSAPIVAGPTSAIPVTGAPGSIPQAGPTQPVPNTGAGAAFGKIEDTRVLCLFCAEGVGHTIVSLPAGSTYEVVSPGLSGPASPTSCSTIETINNKPMILCHGPAHSTFELKVCINGKCSQFPVKLDVCPLAPTQAPAPANPAASPTPVAPTSQPTSQPTTAPTTAPTNPPTSAPTIPSTTEPSATPAP